MIPRFSPWTGWEEVAALFDGSPGGVEKFESRFAEKFGCREGLAFSYGRSALWAFFSAMGFERKEVVMPAYTCTVVANAVVLSGNIPRFVDIRKEGYNMDLEATEAAINGDTRAIVATHLFGYPIDLERLREIVSVAEKKHGHKIWVVQDCAHSFGARLGGKLVTAAPDVAIFGLNISKIMTSVFGGMLITNNEEVMGRLRRWCNENFCKPGPVKSLRRAAYIALASAAFRSPFYGLVYWLQNGTSLLKGMAEGYHLDDRIEFPPDWREFLTPFEARVGLVQLAKYPENIRRRRENAAFYRKILAGIPGIRVLPDLPGATYSHFPVRVGSEKRNRIVDALARADVQLGVLIDYTVPGFPSYAPYADGRAFPESEACARSLLNFPVHPSLTGSQRQRIANLFLSAYQQFL